MTVKTDVCGCCRRRLPISEFSRPNSNRGRQEYGYRCRSCVNETSKRSIRARTFARFLSELPAWPDAKLVSETAWLRKKLRAIAAEAGRRR